MAWNLSDYLPEAGNVRGNFQRVVVGYISALHHFLQEELERVAPGATPIRRRRTSQTPSQSASSQKAKEGAQTASEFCAELVGGELSQRLFGVVEKLNKKFPMLKGKEEEEERSIFPTLPGSHLHLTFPALEFVKDICKVLGLDPAIETEVRKMRRNLLKLINVGEFDQVAEWIDPCISYLLPEVICRACNHCRDIDLCRDLHRGEKDDSPVWLCGSVGCGQPYDSKDIEAMLVDVLQRKVMGHCLQDLACSKCKEVTQYNMARRCKCAGDFKHTLAVKDTVQLVDTFRGIALHYRMPLLMEQVDWILKMSPRLTKQLKMREGWPKKLSQAKARERSCILLLDRITCLGIFPFSFTCIDIDETNTLLQMVMWNMDYIHHCANNETNTLIYGKARHYIDDIVIQFR